MSSDEFSQDQYLSSSEIKHPRSNKALQPTVGLRPPAAERQVVGLATSDDGRARAGLSRERQAMISTYLCNSKPLEQL